MSGVRWRVVTGATLAVFFLLAMQAVPALAGPAWKDAIAEIESLRDEAIQDLFGLVGVYEAYLTGEPSVAEAAAELTNVHGRMEEVAGQAIEEIGSVMERYPGLPQVQNSGLNAISLVEETKAFAKDLATYRYNEYAEGSSPPTTTTTATTTTTTATTTTVPATTTTVPATTTTISATTTTVPVTTTTVPSTTTTAAVTTTTTTTVATSLPTSTTTTTTGVATVTEGGASAVPPAGPGLAAVPADELAPSTDSAGVNESLGLGGGPAPRFDEADPLSVALPDQSGITASLTRVLEPVLPVKVAEVVVSPLLVFELLWRAISSSGRGLVMPVALLVFTLISLLWDRRLKRVSTAS